MKKLMNKRVLAVMLALVMVFAMSASAFADTTGTCTVEFYMPGQFYDIMTCETQNTTRTGSYTDSGLDVPIDGSEAGDVEGETNLYKCTGTVNLANITGWSVTPPLGFQGLYNYNTENTYNPTVFDVIYNLAVTQKNETAAAETKVNGVITNPAANQFVYGFDTESYLQNGTPAHGIYISRMSTQQTYTIDELYDSETNYWMGYSWSLYAVPAGTTFNPANPDATYKTDLYANNIVATAGYTYYMIYEFNLEEDW